MIHELVSRVLTRRDQAQLAHWKTKSYAEHIALNEFYDSVIDKLDEIVENYQGSFGLLKEIEIEAFCTEDILPLLKEDAKFIHTNRNKIAKDIPLLQNLLDELSAVYTKTIYKLVNLH